MIDLPDSPLTPLDATPQSASGKILRRVLVQREREAAAAGSGR
jgi:acyl-CoA synthetase (AMP-forming)/AMP-acid ligase II